MCCAVVSVAIIRAREKGDAEEDAMAGRRSSVVEVVAVEKHHACASFFRWRAHSCASANKSVAHCQAEVKA